MVFLKEKHGDGTHVSRGHFETRDLSPCYISLELLITRPTAVVSIRSIGS